MPTAVLCSKYDGAPLGWLQAQPASHPHEVFFEMGMTVEGKLPRRARDKYNEGVVSNETVRSTYQLSVND